MSGRRSAPHHRFADFEPMASIAVITVATAAAAALIGALLLRAPSRG